MVNKQNNFLTGKGDLDDADDLDYMVESGGGSTSSVPSKQLQKLLISEWKMCMWVNVMYEEEIFLGKIMDIYNEWRSSC